jgi:DnaK suppressor protein
LGPPVRHDWTGFVAQVSMADMDLRRARLEAEREDAIARLASLSGDYDAVVAASRDTNADDEHDPEGSTIAFERSQIGALVRHVRLHLAEVDAAMERLDDGSYGSCETCGAAIGDDRLEARPVARTCIHCAAVASP